MKDTKQHKAYTDEEVEKLWDELEDITMIEAQDFYSDNKDYEGDIELVLLSDWFIFEAGTDRRQIWDWFDDNHSNGVGWLHDDYIKTQDRD